MRYNLEMGRDSKRRVENVEMSFRACLFFTTRCSKREPVLGDVDTCEVDSLQNRFLSKLPRRPVESGGISPTRMSNFEFSNSTLHPSPWLVSTSQHSAQPAYSDRTRIRPAVYHSCIMCLYSPLSYNRVLRTRPHLSYNDIRIQYTCRCM